MENERGHPEATRLADQNAHPRDHRADEAENTQKIVADIQRALADPVEHHDQPAGGRGFLGAILNMGRHLFEQAAMLRRGVDEFDVRALVPRPVTVPDPFQDQRPRRVEVGQPFEVDGLENDRFVAQGKAQGFVDARQPVL